MNFIKKIFNKMEAAIFGPIFNGQKIFLSTVWNGKYLILVKQNSSYIFQEMNSALEKLDPVVFMGYGNRYDAVMVEVLTNSFLSFDDNNVAVPGRRTEFFYSEQNKNVVGNGARFLAGEPYDFLYERKLVQFNYATTEGTGVATFDIFVSPVATWYRTDQDNNCLYQTDISVILSNIWNALNSETFSLMWTTNELCTNRAEPIYCTATKNCSTDNCLGLCPTGTCTYGSDGYFCQNPSNPVPTIFLVFLGVALLIILILVMVGGVYHVQHVRKNMMS